MMQNHSRINTFLRRSRAVGKLSSLYSIKTARSSVKHCGVQLILYNFIKSIKFKRLAGKDLRDVNRICRVATAARSLTDNNELTVEVDKLKLLLSKGFTVFHSNH